MLTFAHLFEQTNMQGVHFSPCIFGSPCYDCTITVGYYADTTLSLFLICLNMRIWGHYFWGNLCSANSLWTFTAGGRSSVCLPTNHLMCVWVGYSLSPRWWSVMMVICSMLTDSQQLPLLLQMRMSVLWWEIQVTWTLIPLRKHECVRSRSLK